MINTTPFDIAWKFHTLSRCVIPSGGGNTKKHPLVKWKQFQAKRPTDAQLEQWQKEFNPLLWGMVTGPISGLFVIDCDTPDSCTMMELAGVEPHVKTRKGFHYYVRWPRWKVTTLAGVLPGVDVRGEGGFVNFCGKNNKGSYNVLVVPTDDNLCTIEQLPAELQQALKPKPKTISDRLIQRALERAEPGNRNETGFRLACRLRDNRFPETEAATIMKEYAALVNTAGAEPYTEAEALASLEQVFTHPPRESPSTDAAFPEIIINNRHLRDITADALNLLYHANKPERIFRQSGRLVRITTDEKGRPMINPLTESAFRGYLARCCNFVRITKHGKRPITPPLDVVRDCLSLPDWEFPPLLGVVESPVIRSDGSIFSSTGYDHATTLYHRPAPGLSVPPISDSPTDSGLQAAVQLVLEVICDFPFDSDASRVNALAALFTPILRPMIDGPVPLVLIDKPQAGTGASLLSEVISYITTGRPAAMMTSQKDDEGWRKAILSLLLQGRMMVTIDNIEGTLWAPSLAAALTAIEFQDRILGRSEMVIVPNRATWLATGNNIKLGGDLPRRCIWVRMDAGVARPWQRDHNSFTHPQLLSWVANNRGRILAAILTIIRGWVAADMPEAVGLPNLGGFETYCRVLGGVLAFAGVEGFLGNLGKMYDEADIEGLQWEGFLGNWIEFAGEAPVSVAKIIALLDGSDEFRESLPDSLADRDARNYSRRLGNALSRQNGVRHMNGLMLQKAGKKKGAILWQVVSYENANSPLFSYKGELGESISTPMFIQEKRKSVYKEWGEANSPNSPSAMKSGELEQPNSPSAPKTDKISSNIPQTAGAEWANLESELDAFLTKDRET